MILEIVETQYFTSLVIQNVFAGLDLHAGDAPIYRSVSTKFLH